MAAINSPVLQWCTKCLPALANATTTASSAMSHLAQNEDSTLVLGFQLTSILAVILGLSFTFFGYNLFYFTLAVTGFAVGLGAFFGLFCGATQSLLAAVICGILGGIFLGFLIIKLEKLGVTLAGAAGGMMAYMYANGFILNHLYDALPKTHQAYTPALIATAMIVIGAILAHYAERPALIIATAFGGAYMLGFGIDRLAYGTEHAHLNPVVLFSGSGCSSAHCYGVLAIFVVMGIFGALVQWHRTSHDERCQNRFSKRVVHTDGMAYHEHANYSNVMVSSNGKHII